MEGLVRSTRGQPVIVVQAINGAKESFGMEASMEHRASNQGTLKAFLGPPSSAASATAASTSHLASGKSSGSAVQRGIGQKQDSSREARGGALDSQDARNSRARSEAVGIRAVPRG